MTCDLVLPMPQSGVMSTKQGTSCLNDKFVGRVSFITCIENNVEEFTGKRLLSDQGPIVG